MKKSNKSKKKNKGINRNYKDRLFKFIFGNNGKKEWTLELYNAINDTDYTDINDITISTIEDAVYMGMKNDVSFLMKNKLNMYEQESKYNANMPLRFLIYIGMEYSKIVNIDDLRIYSTARQKLPTPKCICFYNGTAEKEDVTELKLSDAFEIPTESDVEVVVKMININYGHNEELMKKCRPLMEYSWFVNEIRDNMHKGLSISDAVDSSLADMPGEFMIKDYLMINKAEVRRMCITEYDEEKVMAQFRADGYDEGRAEGREEGREEGQLSDIKNLMKKLNLTAAQAMDILEISPDKQGEIEKKLL